MNIRFRSSQKIFVQSETREQAEAWFDESFCLKAVERNGDALRYVKEQTEAICLKAVEQDGNALQYVKEQTEAICLKAVERNGNALRYVKEQTEAICLKAVEQDGNALRYVNIHTDFVEVVLDAPTPRADHSRKHAPDRRPGAAQHGTAPSATVQRAVSATVADAGGGEETPRGGEWLRA
jgi:hypothetical protein